MRVGPRCSRIGSLIAVFVAVLAVVTWPAPTSAQHLGSCGACKNHGLLGVNAHRFDGYMALTLRNGDNVGGCHYGWYTNRCYLAHTTCSWQTWEDDLAEVTPDALARMLASSQDWAYDPAERALSLTCSGYTVARYMLSDELANVAGSMTNEKGGAKPIVGSVRSPSSSVGER